MSRPAHMPDTRFGGAVKLLMLFAIQVAFVVVLHMLGSIENLAVDFTNFKVWMDTTPPEIALIGSIRILALGFAYWLLATSFLYMAARAFNIGFLIRSLELTTIPGVRRVIDAGLAAAIVGGSVFGGAGAVLAKSADAQTNVAPAAITSTYKDTRVLYNPTPEADIATVSSSSAVQNFTNEKVVVASTDAPEVAATPVDLSVPQRDEHGNFIPTVSPTATKAPVVTSQEVPILQTSTAETPSNEKVVVVSSETPLPTQESPAPAADVPVDLSVPQRDEHGNFIPTVSPTPSETPTQTPSETSPEDSKIVVESPTTTAPKVTVPTTSPPVVTTPEVKVGGIQQERPIETPAQTTTPSSYTVVSGDNFWAIAKSQVEQSLGRDATNSEVANYWVKLIDANRSTIRSGDPDLIFPGEVFTLPPL